MSDELAGLRVLVPRGGELGDRLSAAVAGRGGLPVIAPAIEFDQPEDPEALARAFEHLMAGDFDWLAVTSATTVTVMERHGVRLPVATRVAVVGPATRDAMTAAGFRVDFVPRSSFSAAALVSEWPDPSGRVLLPQSAIAEPTLADGLAALGLDVLAVSAYRTRPLEFSADITEQLRTGRFGAVLLTSSSIAGVVAAHGTPMPAGTIIACIGESTATAAEKAGLTVHVVATDSTADGLVDALCHHLAAGPPSRAT